LVKLAIRKKKPTVNKLTKKKQKKRRRTTLESIQIIKQPNANLNEGKLGKKEGQTSKNKK
jgi:hypothetical protein